MVGLAEAGCDINAVSADNSTCLVHLLWAALAPWAITDASGGAAGAQDGVDWAALLRVLLEAGADPSLATPTLPDVPQETHLQLLVESAATRLRVGGALPACVPDVARCARGVAAGWLAGECGAGIVLSN